MYGKYFSTDTLLRGISNRVFKISRIGKSREGSLKIRSNSYSFTPSIFVRLPSRPPRSAKMPSSRGSSSSSSCTRHCSYPVFFHPAPRLALLPRATISVPVLVPLHSHPLIASTRLQIIVPSIMEDAWRQDHSHAISIEHMSWTVKNGVSEWPVGDGGVLSAVGEIDVSTKKTETY